MMLLKNALLWAVLLAICGLIGSGCSRSASTPELPVGPVTIEAKPKPCKLAVLVVFDQITADYLDRPRPCHPRHWASTEQPWHHR